MSKLIKLTESHYIIVDDSEIKQGDWIYNAEREPSILECIGKGSLRGWQKITHSTKPLNTIILKNRNHSQSVGHYYGDGGQLSLQEVKELIGEVDVEKKAEELTSHLTFPEERREGIIIGYNQALEDNKEKKYTEEDIRKTVWEAIKIALNEDFSEKKYNEIIQSLQPKTEWDVEIVEGKLKLK